MRSCRSKKIEPRETGGTVVRILDKEALINHVFHLVILDQHRVSRNAHPCGTVILKACEKSMSSTLVSSVIEGVKIFVALPAMLTSATQLMLLDSMHSCHSTM
jgi:hypothetical protein